MLKKYTKKVTKLLSNSIHSNSSDETILLAIGAMLSNQQLLMNSNHINDYEFKIFSQFGDDGIIQYLIKNIRIENKIFIEFGVEDYMESNTRFLLRNNDWQGFIMDGSTEAMNSLKERDWYWKHNLTQKAVFIDKDNINDLLRSTGFSNIGLLSIDIDGNDYYIFNEIDLSKLNPAIIIVEYNSVFGKERFISIPYHKDFIRSNYHYSNLYYGASLPALSFVANAKGYSLIGSNNAGNNAYFVRKDLLNERIIERPIEEVFKDSNIRESRDENHSLSFLSGKDRLNLLKNMEVLNVVTNEIETL
jgi:hypothetical protein